MIAQIGNITYPLFIDNGTIDSIGITIKKEFPKAKAVVITDDKVNALYGKRVMKNLEANNIDADIIVLPQGESTKSFAVLEEVIDKLANKKIIRDDILIALGGGVIGDLTGFAASCYLRGIKYIQVPTTLLAQVDSSIGGKTAINLPQGKNLVGAFYQPSMVFIDPDVLTTLDDDDYACGMAEIIKTAAIRDRNLFDTLSQYKGRTKVHPVIGDIISRCCEIKLDVVSQDEKDKGLRMILNYGHTLGHALEKCENTLIKHGMAVAIGMAVITKMSEQLGLTDKGTYQKIIQILMQYDLPYLSEGYDMEKVLTLAKMDKKNLNSKLNLILLKEIGSCYIHSVDYSEFVSMTGDTI